MGRRVKRGLVRLTLLVGGPLLMLWGIAQWLHHDAVEAGRKVLGASANAATLDRFASMIVAEEMNSWLSGGGPLFAILGLALLVAAARYSFARPTRPAKKLRTRRLVLRRIGPGDAPAFHAILTDPETLRYWGQAPHPTIGATARWLDDAEAEPGMRDEFVIEREGRVIGMIGARQWPWVTYILHSAECGKGYGGEALKAFTDYAFDYGMPALFVATDARNAASLAMVRRRGFREVERMEITHPTGETIEGVLLRLEKPVWRWPGLRWRAAPDKAVA